MQPNQLYGSTPSAAEYERRCLAVAEYEARCIEFVFQRHGVNAQINERITIVNRQFFAFAIDIGGGKRGRVQDVVNVQREIANAITQARGRRTRVRVQDLPLVIEIVNPWPQPLSYTEARLLVGADRMLAGMTYDPFVGRQPLVFDFGDAHHHILIAGASGAGKSVLQNMMLLSLAASTSPAALRMVLVDLKGRDLPKYANLPHVADIATKTTDAERLIAAVRAEVEWRKEHYRPNLPRLVLVVDELAELRDSKEALNDLKSILALGRGLKVNCVLATQDPTKDVLGEKLTRNISVKLVGNVENADAAHVAAGRPGTGAHLLPLKSGAFIAAYGAEVERFQAFLLPEEPAATKAADIAEYWSEKLTGVALPPALHAVMHHNHPAGVPVTAGANHRLSPVITGTTGENAENGADLGQDLPVITGDAVAFPLRAFRTLTDRERAEVRRMATQAEFQYAGKPSKTRICIAVFGSKDEDRMKEIDRALSGESDTSKIIRLPQRAAGR